MCDQNFECERRKSVYFKIFLVCMFIYTYCKPCLKTHAAIVSGKQKKSVISNKLLKYIYRYIFSAYNCPSSIFVSES